MKNNITKTLNSIPAILANNFKKFASRPAMILDDGKTISYNDMRWDIFKTANTLRFFGGNTPKSVAIFIDNSPQAVETIYSVLSIGAKAILLRYTMSANEIKTALEEQQADVIFIRAESISLLPENCEADILEISDNRALKTVDKTMHEKRMQKAAAQFKDGERVIAVTYSHGMQSMTLTRKDFEKFTEKKNKNEKPLDALVEYLRLLVSAFVTGRAVNASL
ncbi:MAG: AMP-binding protein [Treponema sp.]|nr:AMP-binding protein [Treponema sp.]